MGGFLEAFGLIHFGGDGGGGLFRGFWLDTFFQVRLFKARLVLILG